MSVIRGALLTASQIGPYTTVKGYLHTNSMVAKIHLSDLNISVVAGLISGIVATTITSPFDVLKTMLMASSSSPKGVVPNSNGLSSLVTKLLRREGPMALLKGWLPNYIRLGPQTMLTFLVYEQCTKLYINYYYNDDDDTDSVPHAGRYYHSKSAF
ncbi:hypothetical protein FOZ61_000353 [Perkinsus olseni]|uniref:Uncharacterized protein n=1 Tax=Perkinsus olseni TaxID=32597 RepID=A0A7J6KTI6_PEROL|nr:hypothetical protein FOZ61_000353 [Perkinsus olseni]KAF4651387.1 hypothetical protein FOL46_000348 [Perkinsus olseni]